MRIRICRISFGKLWRLHPRGMDTLGFEPRAFRMRGGCDTTTPCAPFASEQQERCRGYVPSRRSVGRESCKMTRTLQAVLEKCLRDRSSPICALSQNVYGDRRVKARRCTCRVPLDKITGAGERWLSAMQDATLQYTVWPSATKMVTSLTMWYRSDHALSFVVGVTTLGKAAVVTMARADSI